MICKVVQGSPCTIIFSLMEIPMKTRILLVGCGWRSQIFFKAVHSLKEQMEIVGVLMHSKTRAEEIQKEKGVYATDDFEEVIALRPDFAILCVPRPVMKDFIVRYESADTGFV